MPLFDFTKKHKREAQSLAKKSPLLENAGWDHYPTTDNHFRPLDEREGVLAARRVYDRRELLGISGDVRRTSLARFSARREVYGLTGEYFAEERAQEVLDQISRHQWIEAEKVGRDIWAEADPTSPRRAAARDWLRRFFEGWRQSRLRACPDRQAC